MSIKLESQALRMLRALLASTGGQPKAWCSLVGLPGATDEAVQHAVDQGWVTADRTLDRLLRPGDAQPLRGEK